MSPNPPLPITQTSPLKDLFLAALKTGSASVGSLILIAVGMKVAAFYLGPSGVGLLSIMRALQQMGMMLATLGGATALIQGLSSREGEERDHFLSTSICLFGLMSLLLSVLLIVGAGWLAPALTGRSDPAMVGLVRLMAVPIVIGAIYNLLAAILNAYQALGWLAWSQLLTGAGFAAFIYPAARLVSGDHLWAIAILLGASSFVGCFPSIFVSVRKRWLAAAHPQRLGIHRPVLGSFLRLSGAMIVTNIATTAVLLIVRRLIIARFGSANGLRESGLFDAAWQLSMMYVTLVLMSFNSYYLPHLSRLKVASERGQLMSRLTFFVCVAGFPLIITMVALKSLLISHLYSSDFSPSVTVFRWMLLGDSLKLLVWVFGVPMQAAAHVKTLIFTELLWNTLFLGCGAAWLFSGGSLEGWGQAFIVAYFVVLIVNIRYAIRVHSYRPSVALVVYSVVGITLILLASRDQWAVNVVETTKAIAWIALAGVYAAVGVAIFRKSGRLYA